MATTLQLAPEITLEIPREDASVRMLARLVLLSFWTIIFTGVIRKWIFPGSTIFYLTQDVPIAMAYCYGLWKGLFSRGYLTLLTVLLATVLSLTAILQVIIQELDPKVAIIGLHNYLFYLPMILIFPLCFTEKYRRIFIYSNLLLSIPMCILAILQAISPKSAWINKSSEGDAMGVSGADVARVSGTFNFAGHFIIWVALAVALCLGEWLLPRERRVIKKAWLLGLCTFCANICHLIGATRSGILLAVLAIAGATVAAVILRSGRALAAMVGVCLLLPILAGVTYVISPDEFNIITERFTGSEYVDEGKSRMETLFIGFLTVPDLSPLGVGLGVGVDAAHVGNADAYTYTYNLSEYDLTRIVMELGTPVGLFYALLRIAFVFGLVLLSMRIVRSGTSPHVLPIAVSLIGTMYIGDMTRNAAMTSSQELLASAFILGAYYYPDNANLEAATGYSPERSA